VDDRLKRVMRIVGYGNFNIISFDAVLNIAQNYSSVGEFTKAELDFIEELFYQDPREFGFYGIRTCNDLTQPIYENDMYKVPHSGHYLFKEYVSLYERLVQDVGDTLVLTSGVRSVPKQLSLFLSRVRRADFNMYEASHSLAPPGYSYHSVGDFDVGKVGFGWGNFTSRFAQTEEFKRLIRLPYIDIRYFEGNGDGVRYEPWHVQVV
ncbi:MAG: M15 family metallopeptidase, partial [Campylobacterota bacterium]